MPGGRVYRGDTRRMLAAAAALGVAVAAVALMAGSAAGASASAAQTTASVGASPVAIADDGGRKAALPPITLRVKGLRHKRARVLDRLRVEGRLNAAPGRRLRLRVFASGRKLLARSLKTNRHTGAFGMPLGIKACCRYKVVAVHNKHRSRRIRFRVSVPRLKPGRTTKFFHRLMRAAGYRVDLSKRINGISKLAILAFRKTNGMGRSDNYRSAIFRKLLHGKGAFKLRYPKAGKHVEVDLSRQVMVLAKNRRPVGTFHISSGSPATPTVRGKFRFYSKQPGYNAKGMYYSVYFYGGYATHGYDPVPTYPASHGCVRNPIPNAHWIYNWIDIGDPIWVYG